MRVNTKGRSHSLQHSMGTQHTKGRQIPTPTTCSPALTLPRRFLLSAAWEKQKGSI